MRAWQPLRIKDLGRVVTGKTPPTENAEYFDGDELFVSPKDLTRNSYYVESTATRISEKALEKFKGQIVPRDAVMFTSLSFAFGKMGIASKPCITNQQINSVVVNAKHCARFVYYLLRAYEPYIFAYNSGIDTPIVPKSVFEKIPVAVPAKVTQKKIASLLSAYDDLIANNQRRITLLESMADEIYREWFVRMRFPGAKDLPLPEKLPFDRLCTLSRGFDLPDNQMQPGEVPVIASTTIKGFHNIAKVTPPVVTTGRSGSLGTVLYVDQPAWPLNTSLYVKDFKGNSPYVVFYTLKNLHLENFNAGAGVPTLNRNHLAGIRVFVPPKQAQTDFDLRIGPIFQLAEKLKTANAALISQRSALLPRLISGKLCVDQLDVQYPPSMMAELEPA